MFDRSGKMEISQGILISCVSGNPDAFEQLVVEMAVFHCIKDR